MILRRRHAVAAVLLFAIEVIVAPFVRDAVIRPYGGDALAVALVHAGLRAVTPLRAGDAVAAALAVEFGQLPGILDSTGLRGTPLAELVLGIGFEWRDFLAHAAGALLVLAVEAARSSPARPRGAGAQPRSGG